MSISLQRASTPAVRSWTRSTTRRPSPTPSVVTTVASSAAAATAAVRCLFHTQSTPPAAAVETAVEAKPIRFEGGRGGRGVAAIKDRYPERDILGEILARRSAAGRLVAGVGAASHSDMFKGPTTGKPEAKRWDYHFSRESNSRYPCNLKLAARHLEQPGLISLGGGLPTSEHFPFDSLSMQVPMPSDFAGLPPVSPGRAATANPAPTLVPALAATSTDWSANVLIGKHDAAAAAPSTVAASTYDISIALNYAQCNGSAQMLRFVTEHTEMVHDPPYADWRCASTVGSTGAVEEAIRLLADRDRRDSVLTEDFSFSTALETMAPLGIKAVGARVDGEGILPESIDHILSGWDERARGARKPHVLYTVPSGHNPTGATQSERRRREVYDVCRRHDLFIVEDDPYYFLQLPPYHRRHHHRSDEASGYGGSDGAALEPASSLSSSLSSSSLSTSSLAPPSAFSSAFVSSLLPSLLSLDVDGRVMRLDSFSKILAPGARLGWITASAPVVDRFIMQSETGNGGPNGFAQLFLHRLLDETWGHAGFFAWLASLQARYARRRDVMVRACEEFLPTEVVSWVPPRAGMFMWLKINHTLDAAASNRASVLELEEKIFKSAIAKGVLAARGSWFQTEHDKPLSGLFFRVTYAAASEENIKEAVQRFGAAVREVFRMK